MKIESIKLKNFKSLQDIYINNIPSFCILIGPNGVGKSSLFDVFGFLQHSLTYNVSTAIKHRGGWKEVVSRGHENENITIEFKSRIKINKVDRLVTYSLELTNKANKIEVAREELSYKRGSAGSPFKFFKFNFGEGEAVVNEEDFSTETKKLNKEPQNLENSDILAIKGLGQFQKFKAANAFRQLIEKWHFSDFHIGSPLASKDIAGQSVHLSETGDNIQLVANRLFSEQSEILKKIIVKMKDKVPSIESIFTELSHDGRLLLKFKDLSFIDPFTDKFVSDGTIKLFAYLLLLYDSNPHPLLCVEEPEKQLYPPLLEELAEEFRLYSSQYNGEGGQVFVSTHSPDFLNAANIEEVFFLTKKDGFTKIFRAKDDEQICEYIKNGAKMGYLWQHNVFPF
ncbi:MAG: AAA family ATPase [Deltaproteobacteria bacterium]|jgi:predicted ATPase|nr:AAA family ATPase [Deltaproteobacteria bacterium]